MPVPTFIIAGERRSGTTSLYAWMKAHPQVYLYHQSDENYFVESELGSRSWIPGEVDAARWEATHDPGGYSRLFAAANGQRAIGHKGADLLYWRPAHPRISRFVPEVRLVITLRDPVKRAWSQYWNEVGKGRESLGFEQALAQEDERRRTSDYADFHLAYRSRGYYEASFEHLFRYIDRARVLVVTVEETREQPRETMQRIYRFLDVDPDRGLELAGKPVNENWTLVRRDWVDRLGLRGLDRAYARVVEAIVVRATRTPHARRRARRLLGKPFRRLASEIVMPDRIRAQLREVYVPHVHALETLLGRGFPEWKG